MFLSATTNSKTPVYYRGCVEKKEGCEYLSVEGHLKQGTMQKCSECESTDLCNRNFDELTTQNPETTVTTEIPESTTAGAPSIINFSICLLPMFIGILAYIV